MRGGGNAEFAAREVFGAVVGEFEGDFVVVVGFATRYYAAGVEEEGEGDCHFEPVVDLPVFCGFCGGGGDAEFAVVKGGDGLVYGGAEGGGGGGGGELVARLPMLADGFFVGGHGRILWE